MVGKYTDDEDGEFDKYISRVLGRLSVPKMQNSINFRLKILDEDPVAKRTCLLVLDFNNLNTYRTSNTIGWLLYYYYTPLP